MMQRYKDIWDDISPGEKGRKTKIIVVAVFVGVVLLATLLVGVFYISPKYRQSHDTSLQEGYPSVGGVPESQQPENSSQPFDEVSSDVNSTVKTKETPEYTETFQYVNRSGDTDIGTTTPAPQSSDTAEISSANTLNFPEGYTYGDPVPQSEAVTDGYFEKAVFIGDSRTVGFSMHSGVKSNFWGHTGLNVSTVLTEKYILIDTPTGEEKVDVVTALKETPDIERVYISLGVNEIGWYSSNLFIQKYAEFVTAVKEALPNAAVYVQSIIPMSKTASDREYASQGGNDRLKLYNELIKTMCADNAVHFVDVFSLFADEDGYLPEEAGFDGIHLNPSYYKQLAEYLRTHTIN